MRERQPKAMPFTAIRRWVVCVVVGLACVLAVRAVASSAQHVSSGPLSQASDAELDNSKFVYRTCRQSVFLAQSDGEKERARALSIQAVREAGDNLRLLKLAYTTSTTVAMLTDGVDAALRQLERARTHLGDALIPPAMLETAAALYRLQKRPRAASQVLDVLLERARGPRVDDADSHAVFQADDIARYMKMRSDIQIPDGPLKTADAPSSEGERVGGEHRVRQKKPAADGRHTLAREIIWADL